MADETLGFPAETNPALSHSLTGFRSQAIDQERTYELKTLYAFFNSMAGYPRPSHLLGGISTALDGLPAALLAALPDDFILEVFFTGKVIARYRLRAIVDGEVEAAPWRIVCDNNTARIWELAGVSKEGVPCIWNPETSKWHQQIGFGTGDAAGGTTAPESQAFTLPL